MSEGFYVRFGGLGGYLSSDAAEGDLPARTEPNKLKKGKETKIGTPVENPFSFGRWGISWSSGYT